jgi:hypothetical protein
VVNAKFVPPDLKLYGFGTAPKMPSEHGAPRKNHTGAGFADDRNHLRINFAEMVLCPSPAVGA